MQIDKCGRVSITSGYLEKFFTATPGSVSVSPEVGPTSSRYSPDAEDKRTVAGEDCKEDCVDAKGDFTVADDSSTAVPGSDYESGRDEDTRTSSMTRTKTESEPEDVYWITPRQWIIDRGINSPPRCSPLAPNYCIENQQLHGRNSRDQTLCDNLLRQCRQNRQSRRIHDVVLKKSQCERETCRGLIGLVLGWFWKGSWHILGGISARPWRELII